MWNVHVPFVRQSTPVSSQSPQHAYKVICRLQRSPCGKYNLPENEKKKNQVCCVLSSLREASEQVIVMLITISPSVQIICGASQIKLCSVLYVLILILDQV